jgi:hypothetical protein
MAGQIDLGKVVGNDGQGVPTGGSTGQALVKKSAASYDTEWQKLNMATPESIAIVANGNTHAAIAAGQFVYVRGHATLSEGLYTASTNIASGATLSTSNLTAVPGGGLNALNNAIMDKAKRTNYTVAGNSSSAIPIPSNTRAFIVTSGTAGTQKSMIILSASSGGSVAYTLVCQGNDVSYNDASSNQLIVTNGNNNALAVTVFFMNV